MELDYLREFVVLAKNCQFVETANQLGISQSSLTKHIKALEKDLGVELLNRSTRRVELSKFGQDFLPYAQQMVKIQADYTAALLEDINAQQHTVTVGVIPLVTLFKLNGFLKEVFRKSPNYNIEFEEHSGATLRERLRKGECDIIIVCDDPNYDDSEFLCQKYTDDTLVAVLPATHVLAKKESVTVKEISKFPLIQLGKTNISHFLTPELPPAAIVTSRGATLMSTVAEGMGIGVTTRHAAEYYLQQGITILPLAPLTEVSMNLLYRKPNRSNAPIINAILDYVSQRDVELKSKSE